MGSMYPNYINLGNGGSGNRAIFHTFMEAYHKGLIDKDTDVVIQWTSLLRHDYIPFHKNNYLGLGSVIHSGNYSKEYIDNYFNPIQVINETRHYIKAIAMTRIGCCAVELPFHLMPRQAAAARTIILSCRLILHLAAPQIR